MKRFGAGDTGERTKKSKFSEEGQEGKYEQRFWIEKKHMGMIIGKGGERIKTLRETTGTFCSILKLQANVTDAVDRVMSIQGTVEQVAHAIKLISETIMEFERQRSEKEAQTTGETIPSDHTFTIKLLCNQAQVGAVIGKGGATVKETMAATASKIQCSNEPLPGSTEKAIIVTGTPDVLQAATTLIMSQLRDFPKEGGTQYSPGGGAASYGTSRAPNPYGTPVDPFMGARSSYDPYALASHAVDTATMTQQIAIPASYAGAVIGKSGRTISDIKAQSGCQIQIAKAEESNPERVVTISGPHAGIQAAVYLIRQVIETQPPTLR